VHELRVPVHGAGAQAQAIDAAIDEKNLVPLGAARDDDVLELEISMRDAAIVQCRQPIEHGTQHRARVAEAERPVALDAQGKRLALGVFVGDVIGAILRQLADGEPLRQRGVSDARDEARHGEKAVQRTGVPRSLSAEYLQNEPLAVLIGAVNDGFAALAQAMGDEKGSDLGAPLQRLIGGESALAQVAQSGVGVGARADDRFHQRLERFGLRTSLGERSCERCLGLRPPDLFRIEPQQVPAQGRELVETEKTLDFAAKNLDIHTRSRSDALTWFS
jgi:hypothetical protein